MLDGRPPPISNSEKELTRKERSTLAQLRSVYCRLLGSYKSRIKKDASLDICADCDTTPHDFKHLFVCLAHLTTLIPSDLCISTITIFKYRKTNEKLRRMVGVESITTFIRSGRL